MAILSVNCEVTERISEASKSGWEKVTNMTGPLFYSYQKKIAKRTNLNLFLEKTIGFIFSLTPNHFG